MEIKIDTKKDSTDDIKKTIDFLLKFIEQSGTDDTPLMSEGSFNMFGNDSSLNTDSDDKDDPSGVSIVEY